MSEESPPLRRSGRSRVPNKKYDSDLLGDLKTLAEIGDYTDEDDGRTGEDFEAEPTSELDRGENPVSASRGSEGSASSYESHDDDDLSDSDNVPNLIQKVDDWGTRSGRSRNPPKAGFTRTQKESRGKQKKTGKTNGSTLASKYEIDNLEEDELASQESRERWIGDIALPLRETAREETRRGLPLDFSKSEEDRTLESTQSWKWYDEDGGKAAFRSLQCAENMDANEANLNMPKCDSGMSYYLMGRLPDQRLYCEPAGGVQNLQSAWLTSGNVDQANCNSTSNINERRGWLLNVGDMVQCLDWAPNQPGLTQYLAISTIPSPSKCLDGLNEKGQMNQQKSTFSPSHPFPTTFQIWSFKGSKTANDSATMDNQEAPKLCLVYCSLWGNVRVLKWCPMSRNHPSCDDYSEIDDLGFLAVLTSDGKVRVLDVSICKNALTPQYLLVKKFAFEASLPNTIPTCLVWLSSSTFVTGCANGTAAIWDMQESVLSGMARSPSSKNTSSLNPIPVRHLRLHSTYISSLVTMYPSRPSHFLITLSLSGHLRFTDLRNPLSDNILSARSRTLSPTALAWHPATQHVLAADDTGTLRALNVRRFYSMTRLSPSQGAEVRCLASSPCHASVLVGCGDGRVVALNPLRRIQVVRGVTWWRQIWFWHEWRRGTKGMTAAGQQSEDAMELDGRNQVLLGETTDNAFATASDGASSLSPSAIPPSGLSRITEGYKPELLSSNAVNEGTIGSIIYEPESAIRCLAWNPNVHVGGWAAAGMGSGLVRVEDITVDT